MALIAQAGAIGRPAVSADQRNEIQGDVAAGFGAVLWFVLLAATGIALMGGSGAGLSAKAGDVRRQIEREEARAGDGKRRKRRKHQGSLRV